MVCDRSVSCEGTEGDRRASANSGRLSIGLEFWKFNFPKWPLVCDGLGLFVRKKVFTRVKVTLYLGIWGFARSRCRGVAGSHCDRDYRLMMIDVEVRDEGRTVASLSSQPLEPASA